MKIKKKSRIITLRLRDRQLEEFCDVLQPARALRSVQR